MEGVGLQDPNSFSRVLTASSTRNLGQAMLFLGLALVLACLASSRAYGDVGVVLNESLDTSVARITGSGHSAVYFSRICPASPVKLRLCLPGEQGSVMSNYTTLGEDQPFEWNVVPLNVYLYGVENPRYRPIVGSQKIKRVLEERYRENYLATIAPASPARPATRRSGGKWWAQLSRAACTSSWSPQPSSRTSP